MILPPLVVARPPRAWSVWIKQGPENPPGPGTRPLAARRVLKLSHTTAHAWPGNPSGAAWIVAFAPHALAKSVRCQRPVTGVSRANK